MGILDKFQDAGAKKSLTDDLKSKVGISGSEIAKEEKKAVEPLAEAGAEELKDQEGSGEPKEKKEVEKAKAKKSTKVIRDKPIKRKETQEKHEDLELSESSALDNISQEKLEAFVNDFKDSYKHLEKENRMVSLQKKNYKSLIKLKVDKVSMSEFINFAIHFTLKSSSYSDIVKLLKKPK
jgi:hypothetical protein